LRLQIKAAVKGLVARVRRTLVGGWSAFDNSEGYVDAVSPHYIRGWASCKGRENLLIVIVVPGFPKMTLYPDHDRVDVAGVGFSLRSGFQVRFRRPLIEGTEISVTFSNGKHLKNSPWRYAREMARKA
jgi:hypothetical protein